MLDSSAPITSLYVHVPFCAQKCEYCAFYSEASTGELINRYVGALVRELEIVADDLQAAHHFLRRRHAFAAESAAMGTNSAHDGNVSICPARKN